MTDQLHEMFGGASASTRRRNPHIFGASGPAPEGSLSRVTAVSRRPDAPPVSKGRKMNKTERRWLQVLEERGIAVRYEALTLKLADRTTYTPDFYGLDPQTDRLTLWEVKGAYVRDKGWLKLKITAHSYPEFDFILAQWKDGRWLETLLPK